MEFTNLQQFLMGKTILVTGATGFLAKAFVEKLLRIQSDLKKLYLLLRSSDTDTATQRMHDEIIKKDLFRVLREKWGAKFDSMISEKVAAVAGDVSLVNLGLHDANIENLCQELDIIVNFAAATKFDERFDIAMTTNTMGALHVLNFSKSCRKVLVVLHVSTAYVCGEVEEGKLIKEEPFEMEQTLKGCSKILDIEAEKKLMEKRIEELRSQYIGDERTIRSAMKEFGIKSRANLYGWPNTYVFTKAMGEMLLSQYKQDTPLVIIRPTMVTSTYKEPFPGWIEGLRTLDSVIGGYGKGKISFFLAHPKTILDVIPADMVINCMLAAMVIHSINKASSDKYIYHVGSSFRNPLRISYVHDLTYLYFKNKPCVNTSGKPIIVPKAVLLTSMASFRTLMMIRYVLPLKVLYLEKKVCCWSLEDCYSQHDKKIKTVTRMVELYKPYVFFRATFEDTHTEKLRTSALGMVKDDVGFELEFDPKNIDWRDYFMNVHIPGLVNHVLMI